MNNLGVYWQIVRTSAREDRANTLRLIMGVLISIARVGLIAAIYKVAYEATNDTPLSYANAIWSIGIYFAFILNLGLRNIFKLVEQDVTTGTVEIGLIKPLDWRLVKTCQLLGKNGIEFLVQLAVLLLVLFLFVGLPDVSHLTLPVILGFIVLTGLAVVTAITMFLTVGLCAFWLNDAKSVYRILDKIALIFGGGFVPIALLPVVAQLFVRYSPFGVYAAPTQLFNPGIVPHLLSVIISAVLWSAALIVFCQFVWRKAERRIEVNGG